MLIVRKATLALLTERVCWSVPLLITATEAVGMELLGTTTVAPLSTLIVAKVVMELPEILCVVVPLKAIVPVPSANVPPVLVQLPVRLRVLEPPFKVPAVKVTLPLIWCASPVPKLSVPPLPLMVREAAVTLPVSVAVLAVRVKLSGPSACPLAYSHAQYIRDS